MHQVRIEPFFASSLNNSERRFRTLLSEIYFQRLVLYNANTLETPYVFQNNALSGLKTLLNLHTSGVGYNGTIGVLFSATRTLEFGLAYKTRTTVHTTGTASGNASAQFAALGIPFQPNFHYRAEVNNIFPQSVWANVAWQARRRVRTHLQADWISWHNAFVNLPVYLTEGTNPDINALLHSSSLSDSIPLAWRNQLIWRTGLEFSATSAEVGISELRAGEYNHSKTSLWLQTVVLTTGIRF